MKKAYEKPEAKKVNFQYNKVVASSVSFCTQGWMLQTNYDPRVTGSGCTKCTDDYIWIGHTSL